MCLPEECTCIGKHTVVIRVNPQLHMTRVVRYLEWGIDLGSGLVCKCRSINMVYTHKRGQGLHGGAWSSHGKRAAIHPQGPIVFSVANQFILAKGLFLLFFFVKWSKVPNCPFHSPHSGLLFPSISYKMKHPFSM